MPVAPESELSVLIVDDDKTSRLLAVRALQAGGFRTLEAADGNEALSCALSVPHSIGVIVLDVLLPALGGFQVLERLRKDKSARDIPVVLLTAQANEEKDVIYGIEVGADDHVQKPFNDKILVAKVKALSERRRAALQLELRLRAAEALAATDALTGLGNRRAFEAQLEVERSFSGRHEQPLSLLLLDVDHFKRFNDTFGHPEGDRVLSHVAQAIRAALRTSDQAYRIGGEEFAVLLRSCDERGARTTGERVLRSVASRPIALAGGQALAVSLSGGIAVMDVPRGLPGERLIERADEALYSAKSLGRARIELEKAIK